MKTPGKSIQKTLRKLFDWHNRESGTANINSLRCDSGSVERTGKMPINLVALEDRVLFDAAPLGNEILDPAFDSAAGDSWTDETSGAGDVWAILDTVPAEFPGHGCETTLECIEQLINEELNQFNQDWDGTKRVELLVVDVSVANWQSFVDDLSQSVTGHIEVLLLDAQRNGIEAVSTALKRLGSVDAIHIVSHGTPGEFHLGATKVSVASLDEVGDQIESWSAFLSDDADLLLYGCDVANADGQELAETLALLTGADVAASIDVTGHASLNGNWNLEFTTGTIDASLVFSAAFQNNWVSTLPVGGNTDVTSGTSINVTDRDNRGSGHAVAVDADGNYMIVWSRDNGGFYGWDTYGQKFDHEGNSTGAFLVQESIFTRFGDQRHASVAVDALGNYVVTWSDTNVNDVEARFFYADGSSGSEFDITTNGYNSSVARNDAGATAYVWQRNDEIYVSLFRADRSIAMQFVDISNSGSGHGDADVAIDSAGNIVAVWENNNGIQLRRFDQNGNSIGSQMTVLNNGGASMHFDPSVGLAEDGSTIVVATSNNNGNVNVTGVKVSPDGALTPFSISQTTAGVQQDASLSINTDGSFVVSWHGQGNVSGNTDLNGVFYRTFDASLIGGTETRANVYTSGSQEFSSVASIDNNNLVVVWSGATSQQANGIALKQLGLVNHAPDALASAILATETVNYVFNTSDFGYSDEDGDPLASVRITQPVSGGRLIFNGLDVVRNQVITASDIAGGKLVFDSGSLAIGSNVASFAFLVYDSNRFSAEPASMSISVTPANRLWISTVGDKLPGPLAAGLSAWSKGDTLQFGGTSLNLGSNTAGGLLKQFRLDVFAPGANLDAIHLVHETVTLGGLVSTSLQAGDIVFSADRNILLPGLAQTVEAGDIVVFRPLSTDYLTGTFLMLVDRSAVLAANGFNLSDVVALTIAEKETQLGDVVIQKGEILLTLDTPYGKNDIFVLRVSETGELTSRASIQLLVDGDDLGITGIDGLELVERTVEVGGYSVTGGHLLISLKNNGDIVGSDLKSYEAGDVIDLALTSTNAGHGTSLATSSMFFDASDVGMSGSSGNVDALTLAVLKTPVNTGPVATNPTFSIYENTPAGTVIGNFGGDDPDAGDVVKYAITGGTGQSAFSVDPDTGDILVADALQLDYETTSSFTLTFTITDSQGLSSSGTSIISLVNETEYSIQGTIRHDVDGDGEFADDSRAFSGVSVVLYMDSNGNNLFDLPDFSVRTATTNAAGMYRFADLNNATYFVVVDSSTIGSSLTLNAGFRTVDVWAEQTWGAAGSLFNAGAGDSFTLTNGVLFGGRTATGSDSVASLTTMEHVTRVAVNGQHRNGIDSVFSFNVVTHENDISGPSVPGRTIQGSFRQFLINANALAGPNKMHFVPVTAPNQGANGTWQITVNHLLPAILDAFTVVNGEAWSSVNGNVAAADNGDVVGFRNVHTGTNGYSLQAIDRPDLGIVTKSGSLDYGLRVQGDNVSIEGLRVAGFGKDNTSSTANIASSNANNLVITASEIDSARGSGLNIQGGTNGNISGNSFHNNNHFGIALNGNSIPATNWLIDENFIYNNGVRNPYSDGIDVQFNTSGTRIEKNWISGNTGSGIDTYRATGGLSILDNTIVSNGFGGRETANIRLFGDNSLVANNFITNAMGNGITVLGSNFSTAQVATGNELTQNIFGGNGGLSIDLTAASLSLAVLNNGDGISNFSMGGAAAGNNGIQQPKITSTLLGTGLSTVNGIAGAGHRVEFYRAVADADGSENLVSGSFGEGVEYLGSTVADASGEFVFTTSMLSGNDEISAIAIDATGNTSEFSQNVAVNVAPVGGPVTLNMQQGDTIALPPGLFTYFDFDNDPLAGIFVDSLPSSGYLTLNGVAVTAGEWININELSTAMFQYTAAVGAAGTPLTAFQFRLFDGTVASGQLTVSINIANQKPVFITGSSISIDENSSTFSIAASDPDGDSVTYSIHSGQDKALFSINAASGLVSFLGAPDFETPDDFNRNNEYLFSATATDSTGGSTTRSFTVRVVDVNEPIDSVTWTKNVVNEMAVNGTTICSFVVDDPDAGDQWTYELLDDASGRFSIDRNTGQLMVLDGSQLDFEQAASHSIVVRVTDLGLHSIVVTMNVLVADVNEIPHAFDKTYSVVEGSVLTINSSEFADATDPDGDRLAVSIIASPAHGSLTRLANGSFIYQHDGSEFSSDVFTYQVSDGRGGFDTAIVSLTVSPVNDAPVARNDFIIATGSTPITINAATLLQNDSDSDSSGLVIQLVGNTVGGTIHNNGNGTFVFVPASNSPVTGIFRYQVSDGQTTSNTATVRIELPPAPVVVITPLDPKVEPVNEASTGLPGGGPFSGNPGNNGTSSGQPRAGNESGLPADVAGYAADTKNNSNIDDDSNNTGGQSGGDGKNAIYGYSYEKSDIAVSSLLVQQGKQGSLLSSITGEMEFSLIAMSGDLNQIDQDLMHNVQIANGTATTVAGITGVFTVGYVFWMARSGMLLASLVSAMPAWKSFDPLPILQYAACEDDEEDAETLQSLINQE